MRRFPAPSPANGTFEDWNSLTHVETRKPEIPPGMDAAHPIAKSESFTGRIRALAAPRFAPPGRAETSVSPSVSGAITGAEISTNSPLVDPRDNLVCQCKADTMGPAKARAPQSNSQ